MKILIQQVWGGPETLHNNLPRDPDGADLETTGRNRVLQYVHLLSVTSWSWWLYFSLSVLYSLFLTMESSLLRVPSTSDCETQAQAMRSRFFSIPENLQLASVLIRMMYGCESQSAAPAPQITKAQTRRIFLTHIRGSRVRDSRAVWWVCNHQGLRLLAFCCSVILGVPPHDLKWLQELQPSHCISTSRKKRQSKKDKPLRVLPSSFKCHFHLCLTD